MTPLTFHLIAHTHWDREWYLTQAGFLAKLVPALDDLVDRLERDQSFRSFLLDGQTILLEDYLAVRPEQQERIQALVHGGRLQVGPWYVLADELIPSGESLVRNLLAGLSDAEALGGHTDVLYSPDAFGHPADWPALAREFDIRFGVLWRGLGGQPGQDRDLYRWEASDGREILLYHLPPNGYEVGADLPGDPQRLAPAWARVRATLVGRAASSHVAVFVGADHHAAHPALGRLRDLLADLESESVVKVSRLDEFFQAVAREAQLPTLRGELRRSAGYTWSLQGVHGTRAPLKRRHAEAELLLERLAEPLAGLSLSRSGGDRRPLLRRAWRLLIQSQFHDSICGCTSDAVARRVEARIEDAAELGREIARVSLNDLLGNDPDLAREDPERTEPRLVLWNPVPRQRQGIVIADLSWFARDVLVGPPGSRRARRGTAPQWADVAAAVGFREVQLLGRTESSERLDAARHYPDQDEVTVMRVALRSPALGGFGFSQLPGGNQKSAPQSQSAVRVSDGRMANDLMEVHVARDGTIGLGDRRTGVELDGLFGIESSGDVGDTYTYSPPTTNRISRLATPDTIRLIAHGPLVGALELSGHLAAGRARKGSGAGGVDIRMTLSLHAGSPTLRCTLGIDNQASDHRLRLRFPSGFSQAAAIAGGPMGPVRRDRMPTERPSPTETPVTTAPAQRYVAAIGARAALVVLTPGFFEYELTPDGDLLVTVLRSVGQLSREDLATRPGHAAWPEPTPLAQCHGPDHLQVAVCVVSSEDIVHGSVLAELWEDAFLPIHGIWLRQATSLRLPPVDIRLEGKGLVFSALKPAEKGDEMVLRCYNATDAPTSGAWRFGVPVATAVRTRADERDARPLAPEEGGRVVRFAAGPREIVTIKALPNAGVTR
jgi:mannosylglycerate hydrolase